MYHYMNVSFHSLSLCFLVSSVNYDFNFFDEEETTPTQDDPPLIISPEMSSSNITADSQNTHNIMTHPSQGVSSQNYGPQNNALWSAGQARPALPMVNRSNKPSNLMQPSNTRASTNTYQPLPLNPPTAAGRGSPYITPTTQTTQNRTLQPNPADRPIIAPAGHMIIPDRKLKPSQSNRLTDYPKQSEQVSHNSTNTHMRYSI